MTTILFINHGKQACGVYQIGKRIADFLAQSRKYNIVYAEVANPEELAAAANSHQARGLIYNYYPETLPFLNNLITDQVRKFGLAQFGIIHDPMELRFIKIVEAMFDAWIVHDETNPIISAMKFMTCRPVPRTDPPPPPPARFTVGSHGFGVGPWKVFHWIVEAVNKEFDDALIRINIGKAAFGDVGGASATMWDEKCRRKITKPGIELQLTHDFFPTEQDLIRFLQGNTVNMYFHRDVDVIAGPAGSADLAIASRRALVVNDNYMYRHISIELGCYGVGEKLVDLCNNQDKVANLYERWSPQKIIADYERMLDSIFAAPVK
jgi:hypothetical protein